MTVRMTTHRRRGNSVGDHPGGGRILPIDAHPTQIPSQPAVPVFDDRNTYWFDDDGHGATGTHAGRFQPGWYGVDVPKTGTQIRVKSATTENMQVEVRPVPSALRRGRVNDRAGDGARPVLRKPVRMRFHLRRAALWEGPQMPLSLRSSRRRLLVRAGCSLVVALATSAVSAPVALADRAYAAVDAGAVRDLFVLRLSDDGSMLRFASIHMNVICRGRVEQDFGRTLTISRRTPTATQLESNDYLKAGKLRNGTLLAHLYFSEYRDDGTQLLRGTLRLHQISQSSLRASWTIRSTWDPYVGRGRSCVVRRTFAMQRRPGEIFVGGSNHSEPVALVRDLGANAVGVSIGYYADCLPVEEPWGLYRSTVQIAPDGAFAAGGPAAVLALPRWTAALGLQGRFVSSSRATGRLTVTATTRPTPSTCSSDRSWSAISG